MSERVIKFRAKSATNSCGYKKGEWIYFGVNECCFLIDTKTLGQFTTLLDKNGKEIYEDDLWKHPEYGIQRVVFGEFKIDENEGIETRGVCFAIEWNDGSGFHILDSEFAKEGKVVGSYHSNPELLKGGK